MRSIAFLIPLLFTCIAAPAATIEFLGLKIEPKSVTFVCDGSRWTQDKDDELLHELSASIDQLTADQETTVVFFRNGQAETFNEGKLVAATDANKQKLRSWLRGIRFKGNSTPLPGLIAAFATKAETIVFVSSGEFRGRDEIEAKVESLKKDHPARLHTVGYFHSEKADDSSSFTKFMKRLANGTGGQAVVAYADELRRKR